MHKNDLRRASNVFTFDQKMPTDQNLMTKKFLVFDSLPDGKQFIPGFPFYLSVEKDRAKCRQGVTFMILKQLRELCFRTVCKRKREIRCRLFSYSVPYRITGGSVTFSSDAGLRGMFFYLPCRSFSDTMKRTSFSERNRYIWQKEKV